MSLKAGNFTRKMENGNPENGNFDPLKPGKMAGNLILKYGNFFYGNSTKPRKILSGKI